MEQDSTQLTWEKVYTDFSDALSGIADALKTGADHVYEVLVRQQIIKSISLTITYILLAVACVIAWKIANKFYKQKTEEERKLSYYDKGDWGMLFIIPSVLTVISIIVLVLSIGMTVTGFINPEYGAIQEIKSFIK